MWEASETTVNLSLFQPKHLQGANGGAWVLETHTPLERGPSISHQIFHCRSIGLIQLHGSVLSNSPSISFTFSFSSSLKTILADKSGLEPASVPILSCRSPGPMYSLSFLSCSCT